MEPTINGAAVPMWETIRVYKGDIITLGSIKGRGFTAYLSSAGGIEVPVMWGSRSTCIKEYYGGFNGKPLQKGDELKLGKPKRKLHDLEGRKFKKASLPPCDEGIWRLRATPGPRTDYFTEEGMDMWFSKPMQIDHNSSRYAYRLRNDKPLFSRESGGAGGVHPSNVILEAYRDPGCLNVCGDFAIILFRDCVAVGGYTCALTIINADLWKLGQALPLKDYLQFVYCTPEEARQAFIGRDALFDEETAIEKCTPFVLKLREEEIGRKLVKVAVKKVLSPMPGLVARVIVKEGDEVKKGDIVAILNVMKMEINVAAHEDGKVKEILVKEWDEMDSGTPMIIFE
jgi:allophanate hydrolase subunit 2